jgi:predicted anti-sigma-YlaC factor YlaD
MKCNEIRELLPDVAAGLVAADSQVNLHLRSCTDCAGTLEEFRRTMALLDEWQAPEPSPYFDTRLQARLREEASKQTHGWFAWFGWARRPVLAVTMAAVLVAGISAVWIEQSHHRGGPPVLANAQPGSAVSDLQVLDNNHDMLSDSDPDSAASLLDDLQVQQDVNANP